MPTWTFEVRVLVTIKRNEVIALPGLDHVAKCATILHQDRLAPKGETVTAPTGDGFTCRHGILLLRSVARSLLRRPRHRPLCAPGRAVPKPSAHQQQHAYRHRKRCEPRRLGTHQIAVFQPRRTARAATGAPLDLRARAEAPLDR